MITSLLEFQTWLIKRYPDIKFDPLALQSLYRFNNSLIRRDQEAVNLGKRQLFTSVAAIRPTGAEPSLAPKNGIYYLLENAPAQFSKSAIEIGRLYLYRPTDRKSTLDYFDDELHTIGSYEYSTDISMSIDGKIWISDEELDNIYLASNSLDDFLLISPKDHYFRSYLLSFSS